MPDIFSEQLNKATGGGGSDIFAERLEKARHFRVDAPDYKVGFSGGVGAGPEASDVHIAEGARIAQEMNEQRRRESGGTTERVLAGAIDILDKPFFGARPFRRLATGGDETEGARFDENVERAYDPAREIYGEGATKIVRGVTEGASSMTTLVPAVGAATNVARAAKLGKAASTVGFGAVGAAGEAVRGAAEGDLTGEGVLKAGLVNAGFGAVAALSGAGLRQALKAMPPLARREVARNIMAESGAMVIAGRAIHPDGELSDDVVNAILGGSAGALHRGPSTGFARRLTTPAREPVETPGGGRVVQSPTERGAVGIAADTPNVGSPPKSGLAADTVADFKRGFGSMTEAIGASKKPVAAEAREKAEAAVESSKRHYGAISKEADAVMRDAGRVGGPSRGLASFRFENGKDSATSPIIEIGEGRMEPRNRAEADLMAKMRALVMRRGREFEAIGTRRVNPETGEVEPFVAAENVMPRILHGEGMDVIRKGPGTPAWEALERGISEMNNIPVEKVREVLESRREAMSGSGVESADVESHAEHFRMWQRFPAAVRIGKRVVPILETNPYNYARRLAQGGAARMGVIEAFGQDIGAERPLADLQARFKTERGNDKSFVSLMRALHHAPVTEPLVEPGTRKSIAMRAVKTGGDVLKEGMLSMAAVPNVTEPLGNVMSMGGVRAFIRGTLKQAAFGSEARAKGLEELETKGARDAQIRNFSTDASRPISSGVRAAREFTGRLALGRKFIEEAGGTNAGFVAREVRDRMVARKGKPGYGAERDTFTLRRLGFKPQDARRMSVGRGTEAEYDTFLRRASSRLIGENMAPAEMSRAEHSRVMQGLFAFQRFANMNIRDTARVFDTAARSYAESFKNKNWRQGVATTQQVATWATGKAVSNATATLLLAYLTGGSTGLKIAWDEAEGNVGSFLAKSFLTAIFAGNYGAVLRATQGQQNIEDAVLPVVVVKELVDAVQGDGRYRNDLSPWESIGTFAERFAPINRAFSTGALAFLAGGQTEGDRMEVAKRDFWKWYRSNNVGPAAPDFESSDYTRLMRRAYAEVLRGDTEKAGKFVAEALALPTDKERRPASSLRGRLLLERPGVEKHLDSLKKRKETYRLIEAHDRVIRAYMESLR